MRVTYVLTLSIYELLRKLNREHEQTFILVTHDEQMAAKTDRVIRLVDGKVVEDLRDGVNACDPC